MKKTFKQMREFNQVVNTLIKYQPEILKTKFGYALKKVGTEINKYFDDYSMELETIRITNALEDPVTKAILLAPEGSPRHYSYSKEGLVKLMQEESDLMKKWDEKELEFNPFYAPVSSIPKLEDEETESLIGFVIEENKNDTKTTSV